MGKEEEKGVEQRGGREREKEEREGEAEEGRETEGGAGEAKLHTTIFQEAKGMSSCQVQ